MPFPSFPDAPVALAFTAVAWGQVGLEPPGHDPRCGWPPGRWSPPTGVACRSAPGDMPQACHTHLRTLLRWPEA